MTETEPSPVTAISGPSKVLGAAVRAERERRGWTQQQLQEASGASRPTIARIERGYNVSTTSVAKVVEALGLKISVKGERED